MPQTKCYFLIPAAVFFVTYESTKSLFSGYSATNLAPITHMLAASLGEIVGFLLFFCFCFVLVFIIIYLPFAVQMSSMSVSEICRTCRMLFLLGIFCSGLGAGPQTTLYFPTSWPNRNCLLSIDIAVFIERSLAVLSREI